MEARIDRCWPRATLYPHPGPFHFPAPGSDLGSLTLYPASPRAARAPYSGGRCRRRRRCRLARSSDRPSILPHQRQSKEEMEGILGSGMNERMITQELVGLGCVALP